MPREVLSVDCELWRSGEPRFKGSTEAAWSRQLKELLDRGLVRGKTPKGKSSVSVTITGGSGQTQLQEQQLKSGGTSAAGCKEEYFR